MFETMSASAKPGVAATFRHSGSPMKALQFFSRAASESFSFMTASVCVCWSKMDLAAPIAGAVLEGNSSLGSQPELINSEPYGAGWIARLKPSGALTGLLTAAEYEAHLAAEG